MILWCMLLFFFHACFSSENNETIIVHMPGLLNRGGQFLNKNINYEPSFKDRMTKTLNESKVFHQCPLFENTLIYTNNLAYIDMDLGGKACVDFYRKMIIKAYSKYPKSNLFLIAGSQASVGPFGALVKLTKEKHPVVENIKKIAIIAALGSVHDAIHFNALKVPFIKYLALISKKIAPLLMEYIMPLPFVAKYDAFEKEMVHYVQILKKLNLPIDVMIMHDIDDDLIPVQCAQTIALLNNNYQIELTKTKNHIPDIYDKSNQKKIITFLTQEIMQPNNTNPSSIKPFIDKGFVSKNFLQRFFIRRARDILLFLILYGVFKTAQLILSKIQIAQKKLTGQKKISKIL